MKAGRPGLGRDRWTGRRLGFGVGHAAAAARQPKGARLTAAMDLSHRRAHRGRAALDTDCDRAATGGVNGGRLAREARTERAAQVPADAA